MNDSIPNEKNDEDEIYLAQRSERRYLGELFVKDPTRHGKQLFMLSILAI